MDILPTLEMFLTLLPTQQVALLTTHDTGVAHAAARVMIEAGALEPACDTLYGLVAAGLALADRHRLITTRRGAGLAELGARHVLRLNGVHHIIAGNASYLDTPAHGRHPGRRAPSSQNMRFARCSCGWEFALSRDFHAVEALAAEASRQHLAAVSRAPDREART